MAKKRILEKGEIVKDTLQVQCFVGEGTFGEVYRVKHKHLGLQVLKVFKGQYVDTSDLDTITKEARLLSRLTHTNIVRVFESNYFLKDDVPHYFLTMGFVSGETLHQLLARELYLTFDQALNIQRDFLSGLKAAHQKKPPIVHRDISPDNILISYQGDRPKAMLSDFGLSFSMDKLSHIPGAAGKYLYFAPECFWDVFLPASDVFAAGIIFYMMLTGKHPWDCNWHGDWDDYDIEDISTKIISARKNPPEKPSSYNEHCTELLDSIVLKALENDVANRYHDAHEFLNELDAIEFRHYPEDPESPDRPKAHEANKDIPPVEKPLSPRNQADYTGKNQLKGFNAIAGMDKLKETLIHDIIHPLTDKDLYEKYHVSPPNGMLLYGPPGCGKTFFAKRLAEEVAYHYIEVKPSDLASIYIHGSQEKIGQLFKNAKENSPTIIFIDEIDAILPSRENSNLNQNIDSEVNEFLAQMTDCHQHSIFIIAATNRPEKIDPAILRTGRLDKMIYLGLPDYDARYAMLKLHCKDRPLDPNIDYERLSKMTKHFISSDIKFIVNEASRNALKEKGLINQAHFEAVIENTQPSISRKQIDHIRKFQDQRSFT
jgi:transitional endoplasmic reticulum ATPase